MAITVEAFLSGDEVLRSRHDPYAEGEVVYFVGQASGKDTGVEKGTIKKESYPHALGGSRFAVAFWEDAVTEPTADASHAIRAPYNVFTEEEVLRAIASQGGLVRADSDRTIDQLVMNPTGNSELVPILNSKLAEKQEF